MEKWPLVEMVLATGALGTAAFGVVDGLKAFKWIGSAGFKHIQKTMGANTYQSLRNTYGPGFVELLEAQYMENRTQGELIRTLRQGVRIGLNENNAPALASEVGVIGGEDLKAIATNISSGDGLSDNQKNMLSRFELAVDARVDAAIALADKSYKSSMRGLAMLAAIGFAQIGAFSMKKFEITDIVSATDKGLFDWQTFLLALVVGLAAVPLAPIAKDVAKALESAAKATRRRK